MAASFANDAKGIAVPTSSKMGSIAVRSTTRPPQLGEGLTQRLCNLGQQVAHADSARRIAALVEQLVRIREQVQARVTVQQCLTRLRRRSSSGLQLQVMGSNLNGILHPMMRILDLGLLERQGLADPAFRCLGELATTPLHGQVTGSCAPLRLVRFQCHRRLPATSIVIERAQGSRQQYPELLRDMDLRRTETQHRVVACDPQRADWILALIVQGHDQLLADGRRGCRQRWKCALRVRQDGRRCGAQTFTARARLPR